ncbi:hypothetical protein FRAHR75_30017 [Frankia sp. Hr75.2]|nr:hypothetical protein FRAHR75_30017 [Frankia sp. Hr75.2]
MAAGPTDAAEPAPAGGRPAAAAAGPAIPVASRPATTRRPANTAATRDRRDKAERGRGRPPNDPEPMLTRLPPSHVQTDYPAGDGSNTSGHRGPHAFRGTIPMLTVVFETREAAGACGVKRHPAPSVTTAAPTARQPRPAADGRPSSRCPLAASGTGRRGAPDRHRHPTTPHLPAE